MDTMKKKEKNYTCQECDYAATKPCLLIQHLVSHSEKDCTDETQIMIRSDQRWHTGSHPNSEVKCAVGPPQISTRKPFACPVSGCTCTYKRQDHLNRHMKVHNGTRFSCSVTGCGRSFSLMSNLQRHLKRHAEEPNFPRPKYTGEKIHKCSNPGCEKAFRYQSELRTHEDTVHGVEYAELICIYPGCGEKHASEKELLKHAQEAHPYLLCEVCGETISRKSYRRHVRIHGTRKPVKVDCPYEGCTHHYTRESNLKQHIRSFHLKLKPYKCSFDGCDKVFAYKASRNKHEYSALHFHTGTDFEAAELAASSKSKSKGGRKKVCLEKVEDLYMKKMRAKKKTLVDGKDRECRLEGKVVEDMEI